MSLTPYSYKHKKSVKPFLSLMLIDSEVSPNTCYTYKHETAHATRREPLRKPILV